MLAGELWVYEDEAQAQEVVAKAVERNVVQEDWKSRSLVVGALVYENWLYCSVLPP